MLRNARPLASGMGAPEPFLGHIRMTASCSETYPSENYDWFKSGLYRLI